MVEEKEDKVVEVLKYILQHEKVTGMPVTSDHIAQQFGVTPQQAAMTLNAYGPKRQKYLATMGDNTYRVSAKGLKRLREEGINVEAIGGDGSMPQQIIVSDAPKEEIYAKLTTEGDQFWKIGHNLNVPEGTLNTVTDLVFQGNWQDPKSVWQVMKATNLRSDITGAWFKLWMLMQRQAIPEDIKGELPASPPEKELTKEHPLAPAATRFTVAGDQIVPDPDGAYNFSQALQVRGQNMGMAAPQAPQMPPQDKPSETITAISTAMTAFSDNVGKKGADPTQELMLTIVKGLVENSQKGDASAEVLRRLERIEDKQNQPPPPQPQQNPMEMVSNQMNTMAHMLGFETTGALTHQLHSGGDSGASFQPQNFEQFMHMQDKWRGWNREDEDVKIKRDTTASARQFISNLAVSLPTAMQKFEAMVKEGGAPAEAHIPEAAAPRRVRGGQRPQVSAPEAEAPEEAGMETITCGRCEQLFKVPLGAKEATCPHCGMYLVEAPRAEEPVKAEAPPTEAPKPEAEERPVGEVTPEKVMEEARAAAAKAEEPVAEMPEEAEATAANQSEEVIEAPSVDVETLGANSVHGVFIEEQPQAEEGEAAETEEQAEKPATQPRQHRAKRKGGK